MRAIRASRELTGPGTMTPMIDVVFLLLIFFVWTASFQIAEELLPGTFASKQKPAGAGTSATEPTPAESEIVVIQLRTVGDHAQAIINSRPVDSWHAVQQTLAQVAAVDAQTPVVIDPESSVTYGDAIRALDLARSVGFGAVHFAAPE